MKRNLYLLTTAFVLLILSSSYATAQSALFRSSSGSICSQASDAGIQPIRKTIVYVDKSMLSLDQNEQGWINTLYQVFQQTMSSAEPFDIVIIDGNDGSAKMFGPTLCYPYINEKYHDRFKSSILRNNLIDQIPSLQRDILRDIQDSVTEGYTNAPNHFSAKPVANYPEKHFFRALQADSARFLEDIPVRVIIYSDFIENSDLLSLTDLLLNEGSTDYVALAGDVLTTLPRLDFQGSMVFGYGVGVSLDNPSSSDLISQFIRQLIYRANGHPVDINRELGTRAIRPSNLYTFDSLITVNNRDIRGTMSLLTDDNGRVVDSFMDLGVDGRSAHFDRGRMVCSASNACQLEGLLAAALLFEDPENVYLEGNLNSMSGYIGFRNDILADSENAALIPVKLTLRNNH